MHTRIEVILTIRLFSFVLVALLLSRDAAAGEVQLAVGPSGHVSTWRGDAGGGLGLRLGYRFANLVSVDFVGRESYASVDTRLTTFLSVGASLYARIGILRPYLRGYFVHQHEESLSSFGRHPVGAIFGVGDGIRHRAGGGGSIGVDVPFHQGKAWQWFLGGAADASVFPDHIGPRLYVTLGAWVGANYAL